MGGGDRGRQTQVASRVLEQAPDQKIAWAATQGAANAGAVYLALAASPTRTTVTFELESQPEGVVETVADEAGLVERRAEKDLEDFKAFIEDEDYASGAWRGSVPGQVGRPGVDQASASKGDSGGAGVSEEGDRRSSSRGGGCGGRGQGQVGQVRRRRCRYRARGRGHRSRDAGRR